MKIYSYMAFALVVNVRAWCAQSQHGLYFKVYEAGTDHNGTVQKSMCKALGDAETSEFAIGVPPQESAEKVAMILKKYNFLLCYKANKLIAGSGYKNQYGLFLLENPPSPMFCFAEAYIAAFFVDKEYRKQGVGKALMLELIQLLRKKQPLLHKIWGEVIDNNKPARTFYESLGARLMRPPYKRNNMLLRLYMLDLVNHGPILQSRL